MIVYSKTKEQFSQDVDSGVVEDKIAYEYNKRLNRRAPMTEKRAWGNSMMYMDKVINDPSIPEDSKVSIELQIPQTSKRIDFIISGLDEQKNANAVIVELKQWEKAERTRMDGIVKTWIGGGIHDVSHPSYQAWTYAELLRDFNEVINSGEISVQPCAYLHNYRDDNQLDHEFYKEHIERAPLFKKQDLKRLRDFISRYVKYGDSSDIIYRIENGRIRPSKSLQDKLNSMLKGNEEFIMIDDQKLAFEYVMDAVNNVPEDSKKVIIIEGGPGTGKSVIAVNLLVNITSQEKVTSYVTKNSAPRQVYAARLKGDMKKTHIDNLFKGSGGFVDSESNAFDTLIVDEAHRLNEKSGLYGNQGENQIKELINASRVSVFFIDEEQKIHIRDIGEKEEIRKWAKVYDAEVEETELVSQFRCNGSQGYLAWVDHTLQIRETANTTLEGVDYDFRVFSSPHDLFETIREKNRINGRSRTVAGYCWHWSSKKDPEQMDVAIPEHDFAKQWNLTDDGQQWLIKEHSIEQVGCIHTCQGLELDYVGVIIGPDLKVRGGKVITDVYERATNDSSIRGIKKMIKKEPERAYKLADKIIKNTYRTLMTRGLKGCFIYCTDDETAKYFKLAMG